MTRQPNNRPPWQVTYVLLAWALLAAAYLLPWS